MNDRDTLLKSLEEARHKLASAYFATVGLEPAHSKVWNAIVQIDKQYADLAAPVFADEASHA